MTGFAATQKDARNAFVSYYPFEPGNGGLGVVVSCGIATGTSSRVELVGEGAQALITNDGTVSARIAFGDSTVTATSSCLCIRAGIPYTLTIPEGATHVAGLTLSETTIVQITRGYGN
jgi:hypothetical protein